MNGSKNNFICEECMWEDSDSGECPRCGGAMQDISGKEYLQQNGDGESDEMEDLRNDFDFSDLPTDEFEELA